MNILIAINILATLFTAYWLTKKSDYQRQIIEDQSRKLQDLEKYTVIFRQLTENISSENVLKLLENERKIMEQDAEILRRAEIKNVNKSLGEEWGKVIEKRVLPQFEGIIQEFSTFAIVYFSNAHYPDKKERDGDIRLYFPKNADMLIKYLNEVVNQAPHNSNPV